MLFPDSAFLSPLKNRFLLHYSAKNKFVKKMRNEILNSSFLLAAVLSGFLPIYKTAFAKKWNCNGNYNFMLLTSSAILMAFLFFL
jgi:hypothetical protein